MNLRQRAIKGIVWAAIESWGKQALSLFIFFVLARLLEPKDFGLIALALAAISFLEIFLNQGFTEAIVQRADIESEHLNSAFWTNLLIGVVLTVTGIIFANPLANFLKQPDLSIIIQFLSIGLLIGAFKSVQEAILRREFNFKALALRSFLGNLIGGVIGLPMAFMGYGVWSLVANYLVSQATGVIVLWVKSDWRPSFLFSKKHFDDLFSYGIHLLGMNFVNFFILKADDLLIGYFLGSKALGYYTVPYKIFLILLQLLPNTVSQVALSTFSKIQNDSNQLRNGFYQMSNLTGLVCLPVFFGVAALAADLVVLLLGSQWSASIDVLRVLSLVGAIYSASYLYGAVVMALGKTNWAMKVSFINAIATVISFLVAVRWGIVAVSIALLIRVILLLPLEFLMIRKLIQINISTYLQQYVASLVSSIALVVAVLVSRAYFQASIPNHSLSLVIYSVIGVTVYVSFITLISPKQVRQAVKVASAFFGKT